MLKPAQLYKEELQKKNLETWYDMRYMYFHYDGADELIKLAETADQYCQFVSVNSKDEVIGYFAYTYRRDVRRLECFGIKSYDFGNPLFIRDILHHIAHLFLKCNLNGICWACYTDNPAIKIYRKIIEKYGGREIGPFHQTNLLRDGQLHNAVFFEIMNDDLKFRFLEDWGEWQ